MNIFVTNVCQIVFTGEALLYMITKLTKTQELMR